MADFDYIDEGAAEAAVGPKELGGTDYVEVDALLKGGTPISDPPR